MDEWLAVMATKVKVDRIVLVDVDNANEHDRTKCIALDPVAFRPVEHRIELAFRVKTVQLPSCNPLRNHRVKFVEIDTKSPELFSFHLRLMHHLVHALALVHFQVTLPNQMVHSIGPNLTKTTPSMTPENRRKTQPKREGRHVIC